MKKLPLIATGLLSLTLLAACGSTSTPTKVSGDDSKSSAPAASKAPQVFKVGDTVDIDGVQLKVNKVDFNPGSDISKPNAGNQYVIVNVTITNKSKDSVDYNPFDFKLDDAGNQTDLSEMLMDSNGNQVVTDTLQSGTLAPGGSVTGSMVGQAKIGGQYKLIYTGNMFLKESKVTIQLN